ncbi:MAG: Trk system potassium transporter TrkA [ANME-2 cluster archaeon]|nr:Trk system potassium transporter TrkA [ANME-2 cluster archaeon]MBC2700987.1 Trk system potassium transporter TrkA [ANME-2 cluster archaeon]MBC2706290.1 Trk system potassium transporter TrkA [ANME-2 cluster archaeon]MBC2745709.1 Trk system potassium transporter TrkA [ANME-2 cluster archaeon]MBC2761910.1 Trk system potassium transporter TrkA [ANME-2 cluster archaeon]
MHIIIIGAGDVGYHLAKALYQDHEVVIIEKDEDALGQVMGLDVQIIQGNGADIKILKQAGVEKSDLVVAVTDHDELNIVASMGAKLLTKNGTKTIAMVSNPDYINEPVTMREQVGMNIMICPELSLAYAMYQILSIPSAVDVQDFVGGMVKMIEFKVNDGNVLVNKTLKEIQFPQCSMISAIFRDSDVIIPGGGDIIRSGDRVVMIGKEEAIQEIRKWFEVSNLSKKVLIVGGGTVGFYLVELLRKNDFNITLVEKDLKRCEMIAESLPNIMVINGDGTDMKILEEVNVPGMAAVVSVTNSDEKNLLCSLLARQLGANKVLARVDRTEYTQLFEMVGVDVAMSSREATINEVLKTTLLKTGIQSIATLEGEKAEVLELTARSGSRIVKKPLKSVKFPKDAIVSTIVRESNIIIPDGNVQVQPRDKVIVFTKLEMVSKVEELFK